MPSNLFWEDFSQLSDEAREAKIREFLAEMTLTEKLQQLTGDDGYLSKGAISMARRYNSKPIPAGANKRLGIPAVLFSDGPRGVVMGNSTCFPVSMARGASWDVDLEERIGNAIGIEARAQGANYFGGVCINLLRHPAWGRAQETYGEDPVLLGGMGAALVRGTQKHVMACAKHYALNSMENARFKVNVTIDQRTLREVYLPHFKKCVDAGVASIMSAYNLVNGEYCGQNGPLLNDLLKGDWDFQGFVVSDFNLGIRNGVKAINGGMDIEMPFRLLMKVKRMLKAIKHGDVSEQTVDKAVTRILRQKMRFSGEGDGSRYPMEKVACSEHIALALEAAEKSMVLLKNDNTILPLDKTKLKNIALVGYLADTPNIGDRGSSSVHSPYIVTPLQGLQKLVGDTLSISHHSGKKIQEAVSMARDADTVIIVVGLTSKDEGEYIINKGGDRSSLRLRPQDEQLIEAISKVNSKVVVVLEGGSAIIVENWKDKVPAILMAWYPGMEGGNALAKILFGVVNPSGKLPMAVPKTPEQLPFFDKKAKAITYEYYHGYKLMDKQGWEPAYPFGFGLSYTTFSYSNMKIEKTTMKREDDLVVSVAVTNTGDRAGEEIVQLYVGYEHSAIDRPIKSLVGFSKIHLKSGETKSVSIKVPISDLAYYDGEKSEWKIEAMEHSALIGPSSKECNLQTKRFSLST